MGPGVTVYRGDKLLERSEPLSLLARELDGVARTGRGRLVLISGEAGVGKTSLLAAFTAGAGSHRLLWGACDGLRTPRPLGPLVDVAEQAGGALAEMVRQESSAGELLAALTGELRRAPSVLVLEDMHWADQASFDMLRLLGRRVPSVPALVLVTYRDDELDRLHPLRIVLGELASTRPLRVELQPLSVEAVADLAASTDLDAAALHARTAGNPFFVTEVLAAAGASMPASVRDAVLARAAQLGDEARALLDAVAVSPPRAELWLLEGVAGPQLSELESCLASGILHTERDGVAFRHEIARVAIEEALAPDRARRLHRAVLAVLRANPPDFARLAHHAEAAGDGEAVLEYAPAAAERSASLGAHREAAAQLARALRFGAALPSEQRAELLERRSYECYLTGAADEAVEARRQALNEHRQRRDRLREGDCERWLSRLLWFRGDNDAALAAGERAVKILETLPTGPELAMAYSNMAQLAMNAGDFARTRHWGAPALELARQLGETEIEVHALNNLGTAELMRGDDPEKLERSLKLARRAGLEEHVARAYTNLGSVSVLERDYPAAERHLLAGIAYCRERDLDAWFLYMTGWLSYLRLSQGDFDQAAEDAMTVLRRPGVAVPSRITALFVLGLIRARRGDPDPWSPLDEAAELAAGTTEVQRLGPVAAARAEAHWIGGHPERIEAETEGVLALGTDHSNPWAIGDVLIWRRRAGCPDREAEAMAEPHRLELEGRWPEASARWSELGCPYEAALAAAGGDDERAARRSVTELRRLGANATAQRVAQLRGVSIRSRAATRTNPAGLTGRELEVLSLLAEGMRNSEIAERLVVSTKTVDHHVSAILAKLGARTRTEAVAAAGRLGIGQR